MGQVKIVIWDLDDSFWNGTLSEGDVEPNYENIEIVRALTDRGIINSIASRNDYLQAINKLHEFGNLDDYFVFPQISWGGKGNAVKELLDLCNLRAENAVFIDDNLLNQKEVLYVNSGITVLYPVDLHGILSKAEFQGKNDKEHTRLKQYKILEKKAQKRESYKTDEDFLRSAGIEIAFYKNCKDEVERIYELIQRTNQLNYTKIRMPFKTLEEFLNNEETENYYLRVRDNFGDYGITGFFSLRDGKLENFVFSCRIMGMHIEQYIYEILQFPQINVVQPVAVQLKQEKQGINWIRQVKDFENNIEEKIHIQNHHSDILMIGGCDLEQMCNFLSYEKYGYQKEFNTVIDGREYRTSDTCQLVNALLLDDYEKNELCEGLPFYRADITFNTQIYQKRAVVIYSVIDDYIRGIYRKKDDNIMVGYAGYFDQEEWLKKFDYDELEYLRKNFDFQGRETEKEFEENLNIIINNIDARTKIILINGVEVDAETLVGADRVKRNKDMNAVVDRVVHNHSNVYLLDMRKIVHSIDALNGDNRHFNRTTYYEMAKKIVTMLNEFGINDLTNNWLSAEECQGIQEKFKIIKNRKICIYGTGRNAEKVITALEEFNIIGILDRDKKQGKFLGKPIITIEKAIDLNVDEVIIASDKRHVEEIRQRLKNYGCTFNLSSYSSI